MGEADPHAESCAQQCSGVGEQTGARARKTTAERTVRGSGRQGAPLTSWPIVGGSSSRTASPKQSAARRHQPAVRRDLKMQRCAGPRGGPRRVSALPSAFLRPTPLSEPPARREVTRSAPRHTQVPLYGPWRERLRSRTDGDAAAPSLYPHTPKTDEEKQTTVTLPTLESQRWWRRNVPPTESVSGGWCEPESSHPRLPLAVRCRWCRSTPPADVVVQGHDQPRAALPCRSAGSGGSREVPQRVRRE